MESAWLRKKVVGQSFNPHPREAVLLASTPQRTQPEPCHVVAKAADLHAVRRNGVIGKVAPDDLPQPASLFGYRLVHSLAQLLLDLCELHPHTVAPTLTVDEELASARLSADEDEAQELEGLRLSKPSPCSSVRRTAAKLDQAGLVRPIFYS